MSLQRIDVCNCKIYSVFYKSIFIDCILKTEYSSHISKATNALWQQSVECAGFWRGTLILTSRKNKCTASASALSVFSKFFFCLYFVIYYLMSLDGQHSAS